MKKVVVLFSILSALILVGLYFSYFQQDEWHTFGVLQAYGNIDYLKSGYGIFDLIFNSRIGSRFIMMLLFDLFGANGSVFGIVSALLHIANAALVFVVAKKLTKNEKIPYLASLFFLVNSVADQSFLWFGTMAGTLPSMTFTLISLIFYLKFLDNRKYFSLLVSLLMLFVSFLFKEGAYAMFAVYPTLWFLFTQKKTFKLFIKENFLVIFYGVFSSLIYVSSFISITGERANYVATGGNGLLNLLSHLLQYPIEGFSQVFIPSDLIFNISKKITGIFFPNLMPGTIDFDIFYTVKMANYISLGTSIIMVVLIYLGYKKFGKKIPLLYTKTLFVSISIILLSLMPIAVLDMSNAYLDSRYYYSSLLGAAIFFGVAAVFFLDKVQNKTYAKIVWSVIILVLGYHCLTLGNDLTAQVKTSQERINIIKSIAKTVPVLKDKTIFYVSGDSDGYYGLPDLKVPFQSGLGEMLMVSYNDPKISSFFKESTLLKTQNGGFLWDILAQGYKAADGRGFGYFTDKMELEKTVKQHNIDIDSIFAFYYKSESKKLINITPDFRKEVERRVSY